MADDPILRTQIVRPGQSQPERRPAELGAHFVDVDERAPEALRGYAQGLAPTIPFIGSNDTIVPGGWTHFFEQTVVDAETKAPLALYDAFLRLYDQGPRAAINRLTGTHLDFFYQRVLGFVRRLALPDRAHAILTLKKGSPAVRVLPWHLFSAGKDAAGVEQLYAPTTEVVVNTSQVASIRSIVVDHAAHGQIRFAPVANSADGLGGPLPEDAPQWRPFGHRQLALADVGCALASPVLRMKEGARTITVTLKVDQAGSMNAAALASACEAFLTGEKQWLGPYAVAATLSSSGVLEFRVELTPSEPAVTDYNVKVHAHAYTTDAPVLQLILKPTQQFGYDDVSRLRVQTARITVDVRGVTNLTLESDAGALDPKKAFLPFGPQAGTGSRVLIGCDEALSKSLSRLDLTLQWKGAPASFASLYAHYSAGFTVNNGSFTATAVFRDRASEHTSVETLFDSSDATRPYVVQLLSTAAPEPPRTRGLYVYALSRARTAWGRLLAEKLVMRHPTTRSFLQQPPEARRGFVSLSLNRSFLHQEYRQQSIAQIIARLTDATAPLLHEPYTPTLQSLALSYTAHTSEVGVSSTSADDFAELDVQFFHVGPFGQMREHGHQRSHLPFVADTQVPLVPAYERPGELLVGLTGLAAGDSVSMLFQVAEGSANADVAAVRPEWSALCDNYWKRLGAEGVVRDTTNRLLASGVITFVIPREATVENSIMPPGFIWLKATTTQDPESTSQVLDVVANAVEVQWVMDREDAAAAHLATALPAGSIAKLVTPIAQVTKVKQPFASFGGRPREEGEALRTRAAERLRHRNRAITVWDYERLVLDGFPGVHRVKCIPHATPGAWMAPGHAVVVVVPDLRNRNAPDPLRPKVDADTIVRITDVLRARVPGQAQIVVKNPAYQRLRVSCAVKFHVGFEFNVYRAETVRALMQALSPWAFDSTRALTFGGRVYRSTLLNLVEELPYVDYVIDFTLRTGVEGVALTSVEHAEPATPDAILVSDSSHRFVECGGCRASCRSRARPAEAVRDRVGPSSSDRGCDLDRSQRARSRHYHAGTALVCADRPHVSRVVSDRGSDRGERSVHAALGGEDAAEPAVDRPRLPQAHDRRARDQECLARTDRAALLRGSQDRRDPAAEAEDTGDQGHRPARRLCRADRVRRPDDLGREEAGTAGRGVHAAAGAPQPV